jgi:predicted membrane protein
MKFTAVLSAVKFGEEPWKPEEKNNSLALLGAASIDFRKAEMREGLTRLRAASIFGATKVIVPRDVNVIVAGFSLFGGRRSKLSQERGPSNKNTKELKINAISIFGIFEVID